MVEEQIEIAKETMTPRYKNREEQERERNQEKLSEWKPKTELGRKVKSGEIKNIDDIFVRRDDNILEWKPEYSSVMNVLMLTYFERREDDGI